MRKKKGNKSNAQLIIETLMSGETLRSREISDRISEAAGRDIKVQDVASMLSKLSDSKKCNLGFFIQRTKDGIGFVYQVADELLELSKAQAYGLALKTGKEKYPLEQALKDFPGLKKYVEPSKAKSTAKKTAGKKAVTPVKVEKPAKTPKSQKTPAAKEANFVPAALEGEKAIEKLAETVIRTLGDINLNVKISFKIQGE
jgi:hypothetical protein